jgi:hypothetical protein
MVVTVNSEDLRDVLRKHSRGEIPVQEAVDVINKHSTHCVVGQVRGFDGALFHKIRGNSGEHTYWFYTSHGNKSPMSKEDYDLLAKIYGDDFELTSCITNQSLCLGEQALRDIPSKPREKDGTWEIGKINNVRIVLDE